MMYLATPTCLPQILNKIKLEGDAWLEDMDPNSLQVCMSGFCSVLPSTEEVTRLDGSISSNFEQQHPTCWSQMCPHSFLAEVAVIPPFVAAAHDSALLVLAYNRWFDK
jgi:hypothetical protein